VGFEAIGLNGQTAPLASIKSKSKLRVGKYGVELAAFDGLLRAELERPSDVNLHVVDEIGRMECYSDLFVGVMRQILDGDVPLLGTIALKGGGFIREVRQRDDVELITVYPRNRDSLPSDLATRFRSR
jgi:nucleoside-triphosphatase